MSDFLKVDTEEDIFGEMDPEFLTELIQTFIQEFQELMDLYMNSLREFRKFDGKNLEALEDVFRIYHTLKGDAAYFPEFANFVKFVKEFCERIRNPNLDMLKDDKLMRDIRLNYSRLSSVFSALNKGESLKAFRFKIMLRNF